MKWDSVFGSTIRQRGQQYYDAGKVKYLQYENGLYTATVYGTRAYLVSVRMQDNKIQRMECNCPHALSGARCKHMAATLIAIEHQRKNARIREEKEEKRQQAMPDLNLPEKPFEQTVWNPENRYYYFNLSTITEQLFLTRGTCEAARQLIQSKAVLLKNVETRYSSETHRGGQTAVIKGEIITRARHWDVMLAMNQNQITDARCEVSGCSHYYSFFMMGQRRTDRSNLCMHTLALLYLAGDYIKKYNPGDATDYRARRLLGQYRDLRGRRSAWPSDRASGETDRSGQSGWTAGRPLQLEPRLELSQKGMQVSFRISCGGGHQYIVKNLTDLMKQVRDQETVEYGKNLKVDFGRDYFSERGKQYFQFIERCVREEQYTEQAIRERARDVSAIPDLTVKGQLRLQGGRLDEFSSILGDDEVEAVDTRGMTKRTYTLYQIEDKPSLHLTVSKNINSRGEFQGISVKGSLSEIWYGLDYGYSVSPHCLRRMDRETMERYAMLAQTGDCEQIEFQVGRKHLADFYYSVLPELRELGTVEEPDADGIQPYLPPQASFRFYLDAPGQNVTCRLRAVYGEQEHTVMDLLQDTQVLQGEGRDLNEEQEVMSQVMSYLPYVDQQEECFHCGGEEDRVYELLEHGISHLMELGEVHSTDRFRRLNICRKPRVTVGISLDSDIMNLELGSEDMSNEELLELLQSYRQKKKYYRLKNGDFMRVDEESAEALGQIVDTLHISLKDFVKGKMQVPIYRALYLDQMLQENESLYSNRDSRFRKLVKEFRTVGDSDFTVPDSLRGILRGYQTVGYQWLRTLDAYGFGGILADDMGLGKTLQTIAVLLAYRQERESMGGAASRTSLIIAPASLVYNWQEELRHYAPELSVAMIVGSQPERRQKLLQYQDYDVLVTSYDLLKRDIADYEECHFAYQVIDEAQYIKNHTTSAAKAVKVIHSRTRYALTGTPIENRLSELWSIFDYLMPGFLYGYETFRTELENPIAKEKDEEATGRLRRMVAPFILRRLKQDVLKDLPEKLEEVQYARMGREQQRLYDAQVLHMRQMLENQTEESYQHNKLQILSELTRIRQICCDPALFLENYSGESAKREACMDRIRSAIEGEHKMLVFSQFTSMLELLEKDLEADGIRYYKITGATPKERRLELVRRFNQDETPVFLISLKAGGTGLNLVGADVVIHYDPWWNQAVQNQATDRAHRIGQTKVVSVFQLIVKDSIEEKIQKMQETKKNLADEILSGSTGGLGSLSREELLKLIEG